MTLFSIVACTWHGVIEGNWASIWYRRNNYRVCKIACSQGKFTDLEVSYCSISHSVLQFWHWMWFSCFFQLPERISDTSNAESGSDVDDLGSPVAPEHVEYPSLAPVREEVKSCSVLPPFILTSDCFLGFTLDYVAFSLHIWTSKRNSFGRMLPY